MVKPFRLVLVVEAKTLVASELDAFRVVLQVTPRIGVVCSNWTTTRSLAEVMAVVDALWKVWPAPTVRCPATVKDDNVVVGVDELLDIFLKSPALGPPLTYIPL